ncbi:MAG: methyltransferase domain-containing protein [Bacteroidetes bacterium]|uniref:class I SAM-dependent methyltransferase n=1 Tax=Phnomibacter sp. TaxID=2836217 RepID=UPI002FDE72F6|nr:methyltransferase domain-containing protein [Bacteroidota bacterium]
MTLLNLGCGQRFHPDWMNIDFVSHAPEVMAHDLTTGIPVPDNRADAVYHSHVLEHFSKSNGAAFIQECFRVLKPGGVLRVVVPDLEALALQYVQALNAFRQQPDAMNKANHTWATIEMIDQLVRTQSGGDMMAYWSQPQILNETTLEQRLGYEFTTWRKAYLQNQQASPVNNYRIKHASPSWRQRISMHWKNYWLHRWGIAASQLPDMLFQQSGEKHLWMYDAVSLQQLLEQQGFEAITQTDAFHSRIPQWNKYQMLDVEAGVVRKPDSLFMEALKPL